MGFLSRFRKKKQKTVMDNHDIEMIIQKYIEDKIICGDSEEFTRDVIMIIVGNKSKYTTIDTIEKEVNMFLCAHNSMCTARIKDDQNKQRDKDKEIKHIEIIKETVRESVESAVRSEMSMWAKSMTVSAERVDDQNSQYLSAMADIKKELEINPRPENSGPRPIYSVFDNRCLTVRIKDGHYQWACDPYTWEEIPKYLYDALIRFDNE